MACVGKTYFHHRSLWRDLTLVSTDWGRGSAAVAAEKFVESASSYFFTYGDISRRQDVEKMFREAAGRFGPVDVLVNCAGVYPSAPVPEVTDEQWASVMGVNLYGTFVCSQTAAAQMLPRGRGWIVNIASVDGEAPGPNNCVYSASKAGVISLTRSFAAEFTAAGISVNAVAPGWVGTQKIYANDR